LRDVHISALVSLLRTNSPTWSQAASLLRFLDHTQLKYHTW